MKNAFAVTCLVLTAGYAVAVAAEMIGVLSFPVLRVQTFVGIYTVAAVLALALGDYSRQADVRVHPARTFQPHRKAAAKFHAPTLAGSVFGAN